MKMVECPPLSAGPRFLSSAASASTSCPHSEKNGGRGQSSVLFEENWSWYHLLREPLLLPHRLGQRLNRFAWRWCPPRPCRRPLPRGPLRPRHLRADRLSTTTLDLGIEPLSVSSRQELNERGNFECLGHSNWTICSMRSPPCLSYWEANSYYPRGLIMGK